MNKVLLVVPHVGPVEPVCFQSVYELTKDQNTSVTVKYLPNYGVAHARNFAVQKCLEDDFTHLFFVDSDQILQERCLMQLLSHNVELVAAWTQIRKQGYTNIYQNINNKYEPYTLEQINNLNKQLIKVDAVGFGAVLLKRSLLEKLSPTPFIYTEQLSEDLYFCNKITKELNIPILVDTSLRIGHYKPIIL